MELNNYIYHNRADAPITHVLSVINWDVPRSLPNLSQQLLWINVQDVEDENLIIHFKRSNAFIDQALKAGGHVYVHW